MKFPPFTRVFRDLKGIPGACVHTVRGMAQVELPPTSLQQSTSARIYGVLCSLVEDIARPGQAFKHFTSNYKVI